MDQIATYEGRFAGHGGLKLYYRSWVDQGEPTRGVVVIVHGFGEHSLAYRNVVERLAPAGLALYAFDLRGHGRSPGRRGFISSWDEYRQDLAAFVRLIREEQPGQALFLLGHSMGGTIALDFALRYPEGLRGVVGISPVLMLTGISPALMSIGRLVSVVHPAFSRHTRLDAAAISRDPKVVAAYRADPLNHDVGSARLAAEIDQTVAWIQAHASELRVPVLIQHGDADRLAPLAGSRRFMTNVAIPDKDLQEYQGGFHQLHNDICHESVTSSLLAWIEQHLDVGPPT